MRKRIIAMFMLVVMVLCMSMTAFAAGGVTTEENAVLEHFIQVLNKHKEKVGASHINQYIAEATNALNAVDLDSAACKDLDACVTAVDNYLTNNCKEKWDAKNHLPEIVAIVNATSQKYGMTVSVDSVTGIATVTVGGAVVGRTGTGIVNQTGVNTTITVVSLAAIAFVVAGIASVVYSRKNKVAVQ